mgnify:CR=1 FL=1|jgi:hypothetical protein
MIISHKHKFVFIHIPKNGGCSVSDALLQSHKKNDDDHWNSIPTSVALRFCADGIYMNSTDLKQHDPIIKVQEYFSKNDWNFNEYFKFCFSRNPWDRLISYFHYGKKVYNKNIKEGIHPPGSAPYKWMSKFNCEFKQYGETAMFARPQRWSIDGSNSEPIIDFFGKIENLQEDFNTICDKIGIPRQELPHVNKTKHKHYTEYYNDKIWTRVVERYAKDIEYFGYKFGD